LSVARTSIDPGAAAHPQEPVDPSLPRLWIQPHYSSFNGLRAIAVFLVFLKHFGEYILPEKLITHMWVGVDLFFVLSGFLITGILYDSLQDPHFFRNFYVRRALRIFPVFYGFFFLLFLFAPILHIAYEHSLLFYVFYIGNLIQPFTAQNPAFFTIRFHGHAAIMNISHLWSLCVEEQFYMIWPAVVWFVRARVRLMWICVLLSFATLLGRIYLAMHLSQALLDRSLIQESTYTRIDTILIGAWFALWLRARALPTTQLRRLSYGLFAIPASILCLAKLLLRPAHNDQFLMTIGYTLIALAGAGLLLRSLDEASPFARLLRNRFLNAFGAVSYGFYVIHHLFMSELQHLVANYAIMRRIAPTLPFLVFVITLLLAKLSFRYVESPFLRLKSKLAPQWIPAALIPDTAPSGEHMPIALHVSEPRPED